MRIKLHVLILCTLCIFLTSCTALNNYTEQDIKQNTGISNNNDNDDIMDKGPVKGGILKLFTTTPDTLNPILTNNTYVQDFSSLIFESLVKTGEDQKPAPVLADSWEVSSDKLIWTFHIRDKVYWHNNMPLTAEDVKFTFDTIQNSKTNSVYKTNLQNIAVYTAIDRNTFRVFLKKPNSFFPQLMTFPIIQESYYTGEDIINLSSKKNMEPVGTGPYRFAGRAENNIIRLVANDRWWNSQNPENANLSLPYISEINIKVYSKGSDPISAFQTGDVDVAPIYGSDFNKYNGRSDLNIRKYMGRNYDFIAFNLSNSILADKMVRQAIAMAIDKTGIVNEILPGEGVAADIPVIPNTWLYNTNIVAEKPNSSNAKELLRSSGWKEDNGVLYKYIRGVRTPLRMEILINEYNDTRFRAAEQISEQLKNIGIILKIKKVTWEEEIKNINTKKYAMAMLGYRVSSIPDISFAFSSLEFPAGRNASGYKNPEIDKYLEQIVEESDQTMQQAMFLNMKDIINDDVPYIGLYFYNNAVLYSKRVKGDLSPCVWDKYNNIVKWYIPEGSR